MKKTVSALLMCTLSGCVTNRPVSLPSGRQGIAINCPGTARDIADCMNRAGKVCHGPYRILDRNGEYIGGTAFGNATAYNQSATGSVVFVQGIKRTMIVECGQ